MSQQSTLHRKATAFLLVGALLCALVLAFAPAAFAAGPVSPSNEERTSATLTQAAAAVVPDGIAATLTVDGSCTDSEPNGACDGAPDSYKTLKAAIAAASSGDTINILAGTYVEQGQVVIDKNLTVIGADRATTIFKTDSDTGSSGDARGWFLVNVGVVFNLSNVTLDGSGHLVHNGIRTHGNGTIDSVAFKNIRYTASSYDGRGVSTYGEPGQTITVSNSTFENIGRIGVLVFGATATISGNTYIGKGAGDWLDYGFEASGGGKMTVTGNTITDCEGVALVDGSTSAGILATDYWGPGTQATVENNFINGSTGAIAVGFDAGDASVVVAHNNDLSGNVSYAVGSTGPTVDASGNWWGSNVPATVKTAADGGDVEDYTPWLNSGTDTNLSAAGFQGDFSNLWVDDDSQQTGSTGRIQEGINLAVGSTVNVAPGTYAESVVIAKPNFTLVGSDANDRPVITGGMNTVGSDNLTLRNLIVRGAIGSFVIAAGGNGFTMEKVTVDAEDVAGRSGVGSGQINGDINITYSEFLNIKNWVGFDTRSGSGGPTTGADINSVIFSHNTVRNTQGHINFRGTIGDPTPSVTVSDNLVEQVGSATNSFGAIIKVFYATNVAFTGNTIKDVGTSGYNPAGEAAYGAGFMPRNVANLTVTGNTFENNNQAIAIEPRNSNPSGFADGVLSNGTITNNTFSGNKYGVYVPATLHPTSNFVGLNITGNQIVGSLTEGAHNGYSAGILKTENNWWGSACGPLGSGASPVSANVDYSPWWLTPTGAAPAPAPITTGMSASDQCAQLNSAAPNTTITYGAGTYPGGVVVTASDVTIDLGGAEVGPGSPAYTITGDNVTLQNGTLNGALNANGATSAAVTVEGGADNFTLKNVEVKNWLTGVKIAGPVTSLKLVNNFLWANGTGLLVDSGATLGGVITVQGNLFKANTTAITNNNGASFNAQYNSFASTTCPDFVDVDESNCTFAELYVDLTPGAPDNFTRGVVESVPFDVEVRAEAKNVYGVTFKLSYDTSKLLHNSLTWAPAFVGKCFALDGLTAGQIGYNCNLLAAWNGGPVATLNFTPTGAGLVNPSPWTTDLDVDHVVSTAGTNKGALVYLNNVKLADIPNTRDITDAKDGELTITGIGQYTGFIDLQGRSDDSGAALEVWSQQLAAGATKLATATSAKSGAYTTAYVDLLKPLQIGSTYYFFVDKALYVRTAVTTAGTPPAVTSYDVPWLLGARPLTTLATLELRGGDADNSEDVDIPDASCIGGSYGRPGPWPCGANGGSSDVNSDGKVDILDLTLMGGNYGVLASTWP